MKLSQKNKRLIIGAVGGFAGGFLGTTAGSATTWINMLVGAIGAIVVVFLINGFVGE